ncbi:MAG: exosome complex protein Rrp42 [Candidatus Woesearchaeota archaeon]
MENKIAHFLKYLNTGLRYDNRKLDEFRKITIEENISKNAEGSVRVKFGETEVLAGVKMEMGKPFPDKPDEGSIMVNVELLPLSSPDFESGPPGIKAIELARVVDRGIRESKAVDFKKLCIEEGEKVWILLIDIISVNDAGNLLDASALAALAALKNAVYPKIEDGKINYKEMTKEKVKLEKEPISITVYKVGDKMIIDPTYEEEKFAEGRLTTASTAEGKICAMQKGLDSPLTLEEIDLMVNLALEKAKDVRKSLK